MTKRQGKAGPKGEKNLPAPFFGQGGEGRGTVGASGGPAAGALAAGVVDGGPLHLFHQGGQGDGDVSEHEQGEEEGVQQLFIYRCILLRIFQKTQIRGI